MNFLTGVYLVMFFFGIFFTLMFIILHWRYKKELYSFPEPTKFPSVSFLVPAYNEEKTIESTVRALVELEYPRGKKEIIIINDGSKDGTLKIARKLEKKYSYVKVLDKKNSGKPDSLNQAIKISKGELMAVVDADSYPDKKALMRMVGHFEEEGVAAVTSRVLVKNKENYLERFQILDYSIIAWTRKLLDFVNSVYVTNGPFSIYQKSVVEKLGGFDVNNLTEDIELTWHILSEGYKTRMSYDSIVYTTVPDNLKEWINQRIRWNLGGIQTVQKYWKSMFANPENMFGYFVIPYVSSAFLFAIIGFALMMRFFWIKGSYYVISSFYLFRGYNPLKYLEFSFLPTVLIYLAALFMILTIYYYKMGFLNSETGNKSVLKIFSYAMIYRSLYVIPLILAINKLIRGDLRWYTK